MIGSSHPETSVKAAISFKLLFSNHIIQEYAYNETYVVTTLLKSCSMCFVSDTSLLLT